MKCTNSCHIIKLSAHHRVFFINILHKTCKCFKLSMMPSLRRVGICWQLCYNNLLISSCITHGLWGGMFHQCTKSVTSYIMITSSHLTTMPCKPFEAMETRWSRLSHYYQVNILRCNHRSQWCCSLPFPQSLLLKDLSNVEWTSENVKEGSLWSKNGGRGIQVKLA